MAINKKLIHFKNKSAFNTELTAGNILDTSIVFIKDTKEIWTHGQLYSCDPLSEEEIDSLIKNSSSISELTKLLNNKVDKVSGKSLLSDTEITKLSELPNNTVLNDSISAAKKAGLDALTAITAHKLDTSNPHAVTKSQIGLGNVTNDAQVKRSEMGIKNGVATLDENIKIPVDQLPIATTTTNGIMTSAEKSKLSGIESGALKNTVTSVNNKTGAITLTKADLTLDKVDNTSDANKPVSTAQATAIADAKKAGTDAQAAVEAEATARENAIKALDATITSTDGTNVQVKVTETDGKITAVNITTDNTANNKELTDEVSRALAVEDEIQVAIDNHKANKDQLHIPTGGEKNQILSWQSDGTAKWDNIVNILPSLEDICAYGVEWDVTVADPHLTRIGNLSLHRTLPIQSQLKGCVAQGNKIIYWLDKDDWRFREKPIEIQYTSVANGVTPDQKIDTTLFTVNSTEGLNLSQDSNQYVKFQSNGPFMINNIGIILTVSETSIVVNWDTPLLSVPESGVLEIGSRLDGYDGTVRVYCPSFYIKSKIIGDTRQVWISTVKIDDSWTYLPAILIDAYRSTILRAVPENMGYLSTLPVNSAISVVNTNAYCRGLSNQSTLDGYLEGGNPFNTALGKPAVYLTRAAMRTYCRNAGSEMLNYNQYKNIFYWLWVIEYANFNSQEAYKTGLTEEGYHQGGMGAGVTTSTKEANVSYGLIPCGYMNEFGNKTGVKTAVFSNSNTVEVPRWRGFENPFGDIYTNLDGIIINSSSIEKNGVKYSEVYVTDDPSLYSDSNWQAMEKAGEEYNAGGGYIKKFDLGTKAEIIPESNGGNTTQYKCDYHSVSTDTGLRTLIVGGTALYGTGAGLGYFYSASGVSYSSTALGFRSVSRFVSVEQE